MIIDVMKIECWDGTTYFYRPDKPHKERLQRIKAIKQSKIDAMSPEERKRVFGEAKKRLGGMLIRFVPIKMLEEQYNHIPLAG